MHIFGVGVKFILIGLAKNEDNVLTSNQNAYQVVLEAQFVQYKIPGYKSILKKKPQQEL